MATDIEQMPGAAKLLDLREALREGLDPTLFLLDVLLVLDIAVVLDHGLVMRARIHVHEVARAALDDAAVLTKGA